MEVKFLFILLIGIQEHQRVIDAEPFETQPLMKFDDVGKKKGESKFDFITENNEVECVNQLDPKLKRWNGNSKYVIPLDWDFKTFDWDETKKECEMQGLKQPSAYNIKDWHSLQEITRDCIKFYLNQGLDINSNTRYHLASLGDHFKDGTNWRDSNNEISQFIFWSAKNDGEPDGSTSVWAGNIRYELTEYFENNVKKETWFMTAGDDSPNSYRGRLICQYPKKSVCHKNSQEEKSYKEYQRAAKDLKFLGTTTSGMWWMTATSKLRSDAEKDCAAGTSDGSSNNVKKTLWEGDKSQLNDVDEDLNWLREMTTKALIVLGLNPLAVFTGKAKSDASNWSWEDLTSKQAKIIVRKSYKELSPYFSLCLYKFKEGESKFDQFKDQKSCETELNANLKRWNGNSKYVIPKDWNFVKKDGQTWQKSKLECQKYGLELPTAYNLKDWLSLQDITRNYVNFALDYHKFNPEDDFSDLKIANDGLKGWVPFNLGPNYLHNQLQWLDVNNDTKNLPFIIWQPLFDEPDNKGSEKGLDHEQAITNMRVYAVKYHADKPSEYFASVGDGTKDIDAIGGRLLCQFTKKSICHTESREVKDFETFKKVQPELKFLGETSKGWWWMTTVPVSGRAKADEQCKKGTDIIKPPKSNKELWNGSLSFFNQKLKILDLHDLRDLTVKGMTELGLHPNSMFTGNSPKGMVRWDTNDDQSRPLFGNTEAKIKHLPNTLTKFAPPLLSLCFYKSKETESIFNDISDETQRACTSLLNSKLKRWNGNSKYVIEKDWNISKGRTWDQARKACMDDYDLELPSAHNLKDWLSLQNITREYLKFAVDNKKKIQNDAFYLGTNSFNNEWLDITNDYHPFIIWQPLFNEPDNQKASNNEPVTNMRVHEIKYDAYKPKEYFASVGDAAIDKIYETILVCQYPTRSICNRKSLEAKELMEFQKEEKELKFLGVTPIGYWWMTTVPEIRNQTEKQCKDGTDVVVSKLEKRVWQGDTSIFDIKMRQIDLNELRGLAIKGLTELGLHPNSMFTGKGPTGMFRWDTKDDQSTPLFGNLAQLKKLDNKGKNELPLLSLCLHVLQDEQCSA